MSRYFYTNYIPFQFFYGTHYGSTRNRICHVCNVNVGTQLKPIHCFNYHGSFICNNDSCIDSTEKQIDDLFTKYPIYNLNLNRDDIKTPNNTIWSNIIWSTIKPENYKFNITLESIGLTYLIEDKFYITLYSKMITFNITKCLVFDLKEIYEANEFNDEEISSFPDPIKEYLGIPINDYLRLHFVD